MTSRNSHTRRIVVGLMALGLAVSSTWSVGWWGKRDNREGLVAMVRNRAILFPKEGVAKPLSLNDAFQVEDRIKTRADSAARILFMEDSFLNIGANTTYALTKSRYDDVTGARDVGFSLAAGKVRLAVGRLFGRGTASVDTPTAVVGVKGTDVIVGHDERLKRTLILVLEGTVEVTSKNPQVAKVVTTVSAGSYTEVGESANPLVVQDAPQALIDGNMADTSIYPDPERTAPDASVADASQIPQLPPGSGLSTDEANLGDIARIYGDAGGGTSDPNAVQGSGGNGTGAPPPQIPPAITSFPPDVCPGCP